MSDSAGFHVSFATGTTFNLDEVRRRRSAFMPDNDHAWVIQAIYAIEDPEKALDDIELGAENFVGLSPIQCLLCGEVYKSVNRFHKCPQGGGLLP